MKVRSSQFIIAILVFIIVLLMVIIGLFVSGIFLFEIKENDNVVTEQQDEDVSYNVNDYIQLEEVEIDSDRVKIEKVVFQNIDNLIIEDFLEKQNEFINNAKNCYEFWKENDFVSLSSDVSLIAYSDIWYQINNKILSVYYKLTTEYAIGAEEELVVINIDLENKKIVTNEQLLEMAGTSFQDIALDYYNSSLEIIRKCDNPDSNCALSDKNGNKIVLNEYVQNKDSYVNLIVSGLDDVIHCYIQDGIVKYGYHYTAIEFLYLMNAKGGPYAIKTTEVGVFQSN